MLSTENLAIMYLSLLIISGLSFVGRCHPYPDADPDPDADALPADSIFMQLVTRQVNSGPFGRGPRTASSRSFASAGVQDPLSPMQPTGGFPMTEPSSPMAPVAPAPPPPSGAGPHTPSSSSGPVASEVLPFAKDPTDPNVQPNTVGLLDYWLKNNSDWAAKQKAEDLARWEQGQSPKVLYIGCSDSRIPPDVILGLPIGSVFCHRNVGNLFHLYDSNLLAVLEYAILELKIQHVIVAGHYKCGGVHAVMNGINVHGLYVLDGWLAQMEALMLRNKTDLDALSPDRQWERLAELNADESAQLLSQSKIVRDAVAKGQTVNVHAMYYDIKSGKLNLIQTYTKG